MRADPPLNRIEMKTVIFCFYVLAAPTVFGWGKTGHRIVGKIAQERLDASSAKAVKELLGPESLAEASTWPDFIRSEPEKWAKTFSWHYMSVPKGKKVKSVPKKEDNILGAIKKLSQTLQNKEASKEDKVVALRFLVHLVGDIHQPMHVGRKSDRGGNRHEVKWFGEKTNLHALWDESLVEFQELSYSEYAKWLNRRPSATQAKQWQKSSPADWAKESRAIRKDVYAHSPEGADLGYKYNHRFKQTLDERLLKGGVRLAELLNKLL